MLTHASAGDLQTPKGRSGSVSFGGHCSLPSVLMHTRFSLCPPSVTIWKGKRTRDHYFNKKEEKKQIPWPGQALLSQHFWRSLNVSQVFQLILMFQGGLGNLVWQKFPSFLLTAGKHGTDFHRYAHEADWSNVLWPKWALKSQQSTEWWQAFNGVNYSHIAIAGLFHRSAWHN